MRIGIMGAGAIGCYVGGRLRAAGESVVLIGRPALAEEIAANGLHLSDYRERNVHVPAIDVATDAGALSGCDVVLVTVKGGDTAATAKALAPILRPDAVVVSFQNGVSNAEILRADLRGTVLAGMVPFNVLRRDGGRFHQGTSGTLIVERHAKIGPLIAALNDAGLPASQVDDVTSVQWGKLLINLNNAINALAGVPIQQMIRQRGYRLIMSDCVREGVAALAKAGIRPRVEMPLPPGAMASLLRLPDLLFRIVALALPHVDPEARSSMWDDLERGRKTEVDALNGEIVRLAEDVGTEAPVNAAIVRLVHAAEGARSPQLSPEALRRALSG